MLIEKDNAMEAWVEALKASRNSSIKFIDENSNECHEIIGMLITIHDPETVHDPLVAMRSMGPWHYPTNEELAEVIMHPKKAGFQYTYGSRIFSYDSMDQIEEFIIPLLRAEPHSRRAVIMIWDPRHDSNHKIRSVPGLLSLDFKLRDGKLHVAGVIRSADLLFGWPANIYQISLIQESISKKLLCDKGSIRTFMTSAHSFTYQNDQIDDLIKLYSKSSH
jgi:thymidylate synthase